MFTTTAFPSAGRAPLLPPRFGSDAASAIAMAMLLAALVLVLVTAISSPLKDDVAWLLYVARKWLGGQRLYEDIVEVNPPLIVWIYAVPAMMSDWLGVSPKTVSTPLFAAFLLGSAWWTAHLLHGRAALFNRILPAFGAIGTVLLLLPGVEFGQREHLLVAAALPYLALFAREMQGEREPRLTGALVGMLAALGCALKPSYVVAYLVLELVGWAGGGRLFRVASLSAAVTLGLYGLGVLIFCPAFLENAVPLALALYGGTDTPCWQILLQSRVLLDGVAVVLLLAALSRRTLAGDQPILRALLIGLAAFALAATISYIMQGKNWFYHQLPASTATGTGAAAVGGRNAARAAPADPAAGRVGGFGGGDAGRIRLLGLRPGAELGGGSGRTRPLHRGEAGTAGEARAREDLHRLLRMDRAGLSGGQRHRRHLGQPLRTPCGH